MPSRSRAGTPDRRPLVAALRLLVAVAVALGASAAGATEPAAEALAIEVRGPLFSGSDLVVEVRQSGALAGKRLALQLAVDGVSVGRFEASGDRTTLRAEAARLTAGRHEILVKSGSVRATASVRVWPAWTPWLGAGLLVLVLLLLLRRRRRDARADPTAPA